MERTLSRSGGVFASVGNWLAAMIVGLALSLAGSSPASAAKPGDLNGDTQSDILWRNTATGEVYAWLMGGGGVIGSGSVGTVADPDWQIAGTGDLDGDGKADVVWRNTSTGETYLWLMNGTAMTGGGGAMLAVPDLSWQIAGIGDLDGDGKADVVWRNMTTGENYVWLMNGGTVASAAYLLQVADQNWQIAGVADINGDGKADLVWRNSITGENYYMLMNGSAIIAQGYLPTVADLNWKIVGFGDLDGNTAGDVVWRNAVTGENYAWLMDVVAGGINIGGGGFLPTVSDLNWQLVSIGDMTGDGVADIAWYNATNGQSYLWTMNGTGLTAGGFLPTVADLSWLMFGAKAAVVANPPTVSPTTLTVNVGVPGTATIGNNTGTTTVTSSNTAVAAVSLNGSTVTVTGVAPGNATVTVSADNGTANIAVTVVSVPAITSPPSLDVNVGGTGTATIINATGTVTVSSSDSTIATGSYSAGTLTVTGVAAGTATLTVTAANGFVTLPVTVWSPPTLSQTTLTLNAGSTAQVTINNLRPGTTTASSSSSSRATVSVTGNILSITANTTGSTTITVTAPNGTATLALTVPQAPTLNPTSVGINVGATRDVYVGSATGAITAASSNTAVATVSVAGNVVTVAGVGAGTATIGVSADNGTTNLIATIGSGPALSKTVVYMNVGATATTTVLNPVGTITATSANTSRATVSVAGNVVTVTGVANNTTTVTVTDSVTGTASLPVTIGPPTLSKTSSTLAIGATTTATISRAVCAMSIASSNPAVASVTLGGSSGTTITATGVSVGTANVTATSCNGTSANWVVTVPTPPTVAPNPLTVNVGATGTATISGGSGTNTVVPANTAIADASVAGSTVTVTGIAPGSTTVAVSNGGGTTTLNVTVNTPPTLSPAQVTTTIGGTASTTVANATGTITATTGNAAIATASVTGNAVTVTGIGAGIATVTVGADNGTVTLTAVVLGAPTVGPNTVGVNAGSSAMATLFGAVGTAGVSCANTAVATASLIGNVITVTGVAAGSTTCTAVADNGSATLAVNVYATGSAVRLSPASLTVQAGGFMPASISGAIGTLNATSADTAIATASISAVAPNTVIVNGVAPGTTTVTVSADNGSDTLTVTVIAAQALDTGLASVTSSTTYTIVAASDLGMYAADQDFQIFSMQPPLNTLNAQVIAKGANTATGTVIKTGNDVDVYYAPTGSAVDPVAANSVNTTSFNSATVYKTNFWQQSGNQTLGGQAYGLLYPAWDNLAALSCDSPPCASLLDLYAPISPDLGLPMFDLNVLYPLTGSGAIVTDQQAQASVQALSPYKANAYKTNTPQAFGKYEADVQFFRNVAGFGGGTMTGMKRFTAGGIPVAPVDDAGRSNYYPLMRVAVVAKGASPLVATNILRSVDVVAPTSSERDCKVCHALLADQPADWLTASTSRQPFNGYASDNLLANGYTYQDFSTPLALVSSTDPSVPGPDKLENAAKLNILMLHDSKNGDRYVDSDTGAGNPCLSGTEASCLAVRRNIVCSQCHYSALLDFAQVGPVTETNGGPNARQQTLHSTLSRNMHFIHGGKSVVVNGTPAKLFPDMPPPGSAGRTIASANALVDQTCNLCHAGALTQHDRGTMNTAGVVCQDCHGSMRQLGNDFSAATAGSPDLGKRIPWLTVPQCDSCHIGDVLTVVGGGNTGVANPPASAANLGLTGLMAGNGLTALQAYSATAGAQSSLGYTSVPGSRFSARNATYTKGTNQTGLFRQSTGHGGVLCQGCHGSTHAEWPNANANANDNLAATQLQGHPGLVMECTTCHTGTMNRNLNGPHGMHTVNDSTFWNGGHSSLMNSVGKNACRACHGASGQGTPLSAVAADRLYTSGNINGGSHAYTKGTPVKCNDCHGQQL